MYRYASTEYRYPTRTSSSANNRRFDPRLEWSPPFQQIGFVIRIQYHQLELDEESRQITTFTTHKRLFQYKRLKFGTNSASEIFQHKIQGVFNGIPGCRNISDDIIVFGKTQNEHDKTLEMILQVAEQHYLKFNFAKFDSSKNT